MSAAAVTTAVCWAAGLSLLCVATQCSGIGIRHGRSRNARNLRPNSQVPSKITGPSSAAGVLDNDIVNRLLRIVESQQQLGNNCTAGTHLNLGEGVVDRYAQVVLSFFFCHSRDAHFLLCCLYIPGRSNIQDVEELPCVHFSSGLFVTAHVHDFEFCKIVIYRTGYKSG